MVKVQTESPAERIRRSVTIDESGCWLWQLSIDRDGYGRITIRTNGGKRTAHAHRISYEVLVGPIPEGLQLDHLCRTRHCVNPDHLEPVTNRENSLRSLSFAALNARKTHCAHGHPFDEANTYRNRGRRFCRTCQRNSDRARRAS